MNSLTGVRMNQNPKTIAFRAIAGLSLIALGLLVLVMPGCSKKNADAGSIVAEVGQRPIKLREITDYITAMHVNYSTADEELKARRKQLDRLVEEKLLVIGAYARALDADIGILELVDNEKDKFLLDELYRTEVLDKVSVSEDDVKAWYTHYFERVRPKHIVVPTKATADSIMAQLQSGVDFGDLAERYSIDQSTARRGGDLGREFYWGELVPPIQDVVFGLKEEELGGPVKTGFGWHILKVVSRSELQKVPYDTVKNSIENRIKQKLVSKRRDEQLDALRAQANVQVRPEALATLRQMLQSVMDTVKLPPGSFPDLPAEKLADSGKTIVLATYGRNGELTLYRVLTSYNSTAMDGRPDFRVDDQVREMGFQMGLYDLLRDQALSLKLDQSPIYRERLREFQESMMADKMRSAVITSKLRVEEPEIRQYFDAHADSFVDPASYHVREVLVNDEPSAIRMIREAQAGTPLEELAKKYTVRPGFRTNGGDLGWVSPNRYPDLCPTAATLKPGEIGGPVPGVGQFSVIQLLESKPASPRKFEDLKGEIFQRLQQQRADSILEAYVDSMKIAYPIVIHDDVLTMNITAGSASYPKGKG